MLSNHFQNGIETAKLAWARLPNTEDGEGDEVVGVSRKNDGSRVESLDYEVVENHAYREEQAQRGKLYVGYYVGVKWFFALLIGVGTGLAAVFINISVENFAGWKFSLTFSVIQKSYVAGFLLYILINLVLVFSSAFIITNFAPAAAGSGIPEIKGYLNGVDTHGILLFRTLIGKIFGSIGSVGGGLALGKEGPLVHTGACIASLLGQGGSTKYHLSSRWLQFFNSDRDRRDLVTCGCAAGVAAAFRAPVGGVLFALEEVTSWWRSQLMWRVFFTSAIVAVVVRTAMGWCKSGKCGHFGSGGFIIWDISGGQEDYSFEELLPMAGIGPKNLPLALAGNRRSSSPKRPTDNPHVSDQKINKKKMDEELLELQRQFEFAQQAKSSIRLSDRNVVELVQKLHDLRIIDFDLLHTVSGKEYITPEQLSLEIIAEIDKLGRVSLIDLADATGVDLYHVEKQTQRIVSNDASLTLINGEVISTSYWDTVAEEINDRLQECSQIALAEIAGQLQVGSELIATVLEPRLGTLVKGRLEGGQLYTPAYVSRVNAMVCGASRGITVPTNLSAVWSSLQMLLQEMDGASGVAVESSFFQTLFNGLVKDGEILGSLRAGIHWTPAVFAIAQKESVDSFFSQNSFVSYEFLHKLGIPQPIQYLQSRYPEGIPLESIFVHPSTIEMLDAAAEDAIERNSWIDSLSVLPASFASQDASRILSLCRSVQVAVKSNKALILGESYVFGMGFVKDLFDRMEKETEICNLSGFSGTVRDDLHAVGEAKTGKETSSTIAESNEIVNVSSTNKQGFEKGSKKRKGKSAGKTGPAETGSDTQEPTVPSKSKKNQRKGKDTASFQVLDAKSGAKKESDRTKEDNLFVSEEWLIEKTMSLFPEFDEQGMDDPETILRPLANHVRPMLLNSWKERRKVAFTDNAQRMKRVLDNLQRKIDESFLNMQLYEKALDLFEDDQSTSVILHRHLLRTTATSIVDTVLLNLDIHDKIKNGIEVEESQNPESKSLSSGERIAFAKSLPGLLSVKAVALVESLEGKSVESFVTAFRAMAEESGLTLKKLDKKLERTLLHSYRKDLISQVSAEVDPVPLLPKVVSLLYIQVHNKALQAPGRAISVAVSRLKEKLDDSAYKILMDYHTATVALLALMSAATGDDEDCTSDRVLTKKELLEGLMPELKGLVLSSSQS